MTTPARSWLGLYIFVGGIWGCSFFFIKEGLHVASPFGVAFWRVACGAVAINAVRLAQRIRLPRDVAWWRDVTVVALLWNGVPGFLFPLAEVHASSVLTGLINGSVPVLTVVAIALTGRGEKIERTHVAGVAIGFVGLFVLLHLWTGLGGASMWSVLELIFSCSLYALAFPYSRRRLSPRGLSVSATASGQTLVATVLTAPLYLLDSHGSGGGNIADWLCLVALGALGTGLAFAANQHLIATAGSAIASTATYLTPLVAVILGAGLLHEPVHWYEGAGGVIIILGAATAQGRFQRRRL